MKGFLIAGGSVPGTEHAKPGQPGWCNNQDAFAWHEGDDHIVAVVADGCSDSPYSEAGAQLAARYIANSFAALISWGGLKEHLFTHLETIEASALGFIDRLSGELAAGESPYRFRKEILDRFLFTVVGVAMDRNLTAVFALGDGLYSVNGAVERLGPFPGNEPPYLAYRLLRSKAPGLSAVAVLPTADVRSLMIGTDGAADLIFMEETPLPGRDEPVGPISQFWEDERFMKNPDAIRRRLALINRERAVDNHVKKGLLPDDTTVVVIRREPETEH